MFAVPNFDTLEALILHGVGKNLGLKIVVALGRDFGVKRSIGVYVADFVARHASVSYDQNDAPGLAAICATSI